MKHIIIILIIIWGVKSDQEAILNQFLQKMNHDDINGCNTKYVECNEEKQVLSMYVQI